MVAVPSAPEDLNLVSDCEAIGDGDGSKGNTVGKTIINHPFGNGLYMFAPTRTLLHTYNRHDHHHHHHYHHHHHHHNHHLYLREGSTFATPSVQYFDWGKNTNYVSMRDQHLPLL